MNQMEDNSISVGDGQSSKQSSKISYIDSNIYSNVKWGESFKSNS